jgi:hypothetical protein
MKAGCGDSLPIIQRGIMTQHASDREIRQGGQTAAPPIPPFKDVALPALAAAVYAAKLQPRRPKTSVLPAILRKEAVLG